MEIILSGSSVDGNVRIPSDASIDSSKLKPIDDLIERIHDEYRTLCNIQTIVERYIPIMNEFWELSLPFRHNTDNDKSAAYNVKLENMIDTLNRLYGVSRTLIAVNVHKYTTSAWGHVYWNFFHLSSILILYAFQQKRIQSLLDFPTLVYNIDVILPCSICKAHYENVKYTHDVKNDIVKHMSFGSLVTGLMHFHNVITVNVDKTVQYADKPKRRLYGMADFALTYQCIEMADETIKLSTDYYRNYIDWQPPTHTLLSILFSTYCNVRYTRTSNQLKFMLYNHFRNEVDIGLKHTTALAYSENELRYQRLTPKQIKYVLMRSILLQLDETSMTEQQVRDNKLFNYAIVVLYKKYPEIVRNLMELNVSSSDLVDNLEDSSKISSTNVPNKMHLEKLLRAIERLDSESIELSRV